MQPWLKVVHRFDPAVATEVGDPHRWGAVGEPLMRPAFAPGDGLLIYVAGTFRCPALCEVAGEPWFDPGRERWGWRTPVRVLAACPLEEAPLLADAGISPRSVGRQARLRLRPEGFARAAAMVRAAQVPQNVRYGPQSGPAGSA